MEDIQKELRVFAFYLPQFHPIPENDKWWGKGFTEWTNVGKAKKYFKGHYQPRVPADLGYYDLRVPETRQAQADMAHKYGIDGFLYWHYWFGNGKQLLERPFNEVLTSGEPNFPFALAWANESWKGFAHGLRNRNMLIEQQYLGDEDYIAHFNTILPALKDKRYITIHGKHLLMIYKPELLPDAKHFIELWQSLAIENGLKGIYFIAHHQCRKDHNGKSEDETLTEMLSYGFDAVNFVRLWNYVEHRSLYAKITGRLNRIFRRVPLVYSYKKIYPTFSNPIDSNSKVIPTIIPGWDHSPRSGKDGFVMKGSTPALFEKHVEKILDSIKEKTKEERIVFIKSWNEWAEGNYMEPDLKFGKKYLEALKNSLEKI
ncbi:glycosyl transferase [Bacteroidia bacterium]|nr:glycosyl transferase [Bacteroidia bacterium]